MVWRLGYEVGGLGYEVLDATANGGPPVTRVRGFEPWQPRIGLGFEDLRLGSSELD